VLCHRAELASLEALESINMGDNPLRRIPAWAATLPKLTTFHVSGDDIDPASLAWIKQVRPELSLR
jgi:hypothetical protein